MGVKNHITAWLVNWVKKVGKFCDYKGTDLFPDTKGVPLDVDFRPPPIQAK